MNKENTNLTTLNSTIIDNINHFLSSNKWSIKDLSDASDIPYESLKKLVNGKVKNPSMSSLVKIAEAMDCSLDYLVGRPRTYGVDISHLPKRSIKLLEDIASLEMLLFSESKKHQGMSIPVFISTSKTGDSFLIDSYATESVEAPHIYTDYYDSILCGVKLTGSNLEPTYYHNDILLVAKDRYPENGEVGLFLVGNLMYIRKYYHDRGVRLESINTKKPPIMINDINDLHFFGRVLTVLRY